MSKETILVRLAGSAYELATSTLDQLRRADAYGPDQVHEIPRGITQIIHV